MPAMDPVILLFVLGVVAGLARADLRLPGAIYEFVSTVLLLAIGLKGGVELARDTGGTPLTQFAVLVALGLALPLPVFAIARHARPPVPRGRRVPRSSLRLGQRRHVCRRHRIPRIARNRLRGARARLGGD